VCHIYKKPSLFHIGQEFSERQPVLRVKSQVISHVFFYRFQLTELLGESFTQEVGDLCIEATVLDPLSNKTLIGVHLLNVREH
jgi:hypothetical protein